MRNLIDSESVTLDGVMEAPRELESFFRDLKAWNMFERIRTGTFGNGVVLHHISQKDDTAGVDLI